MITTARQLRTLADRTGLDAFADVLRDAAGMVERLEERVQELEQAPTFTAAQPVAYALFAENGNIRIWSQQPLEISGVVPLYVHSPSASGTQSKPPVDAIPAATETEVLCEALNETRNWFEQQARAVSKGCGSSYELHDLRVQRDALDAALASAAQPADDPEWDKVLRERDDADDFIDALLDEVLGADRAEWSSLYGRADALNDVRERMTALEKPATDRAWGRFETAMDTSAAPKAAPAQSEWPLLEHEAALHEDGTARFGPGVSAKLLVEAAYRNAERTKERQQMTGKQRQEEERKRRALWDMVHGAPAELPEWWNKFIQGVCEIADRSSPEDEPDAIVATPDELAACALNAIENDRASRGQAPAPTAVAGPSETVKFVDESTADPVEKARRYLKAMGDQRTNSTYFYDDGYPRRESASDALATLAVLEQLAAAPTTQAAPARDLQAVIKAAADKLDAARLDWLLGPGRRMAIDGFGGQYRVVDASCNLVITDWHPTQRAAIDAARAAKEGLYP